MFKQITQLGLFYQYLITSDSLIVTYIIIITGSHVLLFLLKIIFPGREINSACDTPMNKRKILIS